MSVVMVEIALNILEYLFQRRFDEFDLNDINDIEK